MEFIIKHKPINEMTADDKRWLYADWKRRNELARKASAVFLLPLACADALYLGKMLRAIVSFSISGRMFFGLLLSIGLFAFLIICNAQIARGVFSGYVCTLACYAALPVIDRVAGSTIYAMMFCVSLIPAVFIVNGIMNHKIYEQLKAEKGFPSFMYTQSEVQSAEIYGVSSQPEAQAEEDYRGWNAFGSDAQEDKELQPATDADNTLETQNKEGDNSHDDEN